MQLDISPEHLQLVKDILQRRIPDRTVWAFGSRANGNAKPYSDLDLAVLGDQPLTLQEHADLADDFSESDLPWKVDLVDWCLIDDGFRAEIGRGYAVIQAWYPILIKPSKPFLKWAGGKHKLAPFIAQHLPQRPSKRLVEPFAGSAAVSLALEFDGYVLNDSNRDLIGVYQTLKAEKQSFIDYVRSFWLPENNQEHRFYELRERFNTSQDYAERAALFIYLNRHAFNGLCRYNSKGMFNVPFGRYKAPYFPEREMQAFVDKSARIELMCGDFQAALDLVGSDDVVYCDPPYAPLSLTASFTAYSQNSFNADDQIRLAKLAEIAAQRTQGVLVSNHDTEFTREIYRNASLKTIDVQRNIAAKGSSRQKVAELLAVYENRF